MEETKNTENFDEVLDENEEVEIEEPAKESKFKKAVSKAKDKIKDVKVNDGVDTCLLQVKNGDVDALIIDKPVVDRAVKANKAFKTVGETLDAESYAFAVAKGDKDLLEKINKGLENIKKDGTYEKLYKKWFEGK